MFELLDVKEAAKLLNVKISWIRKAILNKELKIVKLKRLVRINKSDLKNFIKNNTREN